MKNSFVIVIICFILLAIIEVLISYYAGNAKTLFFGMVHIIAFTIMAIMEKIVNKRKEG